MNHSTVRSACHWLFYGLLLANFACTKELDIALPVTPSQLVLNGLLHPDSTIRISLTTTLPSSVSSTDFPVVNNATVRLYEDGELLSNLTFQDSVYVLDYRPKPGEEYAVEVEVPGFEVVSATDRMPYSLEVEVCLLKESPSEFNYLWFEATMTDHPGKSNYYWFDIAVSDYSVFNCAYFREEDTLICNNDASTLYVENMAFLHSYSTVPDNFNAYVDNTTEGITEYDRYIRVDDNTLNGKRITLEMTSQYDPMFQYGELSRLDSNQTAVLQITNASQHYDRYLKSSVIYFLNNDYFYGPNPFSETTQIYSNVENGTGIFAAYNSVSIAVEDHPCR